MYRHQYCSNLDTSVFEYLGDLEGVEHSEVMPVGIDFNSERQCETPERLKARFRRVHYQMKQPVFQHDTV
jgi:hypothetical protein